MRLLGAIMIMLLIQVGVMVFDGLMYDTTNPADNTLNPYNMTGQNINGTTSDVWTFATNPSLWSDSYFLEFLLTALGTTSVLVGLAYVVFRSDIILLFGVFIWLIGIGSVPVVSLYSFVTREAGFYACTIGTSCTVSQLAGLFTAGVLGVFWIFACVEWWTNRSMT